MKKIVPVFLALILVTGFGCVTRNNAFLEADKSVNAKEFSKASSIVKENKNKNLYKDNDLVLKNLDLGSLSFYSGNFKESTQYFSDAERLIEEYYTKSVSEAAGSLLVNDTVLTYSGEEFENLYLNVFKAVAYLQMKSFDDAFVEIKKLNDKVNLMDDKYSELAEKSNSSKDSAGLFKAGKVEYTKSALAHWISAIMYRTDKKLDDARIDVDQIKQAFKTQSRLYNFPLPPVDDILKNPSEPRTSFLFFTGNSPMKRALTFRVQTSAGEVRVALDNENDSGYLQNDFSLTLSVPGIEGGYNFKCQVPIMTLRQSPVKSIEVYSDGNKLGNLSVIEKMDSVAESTFKIKEPITYVKTILRTVVKGIAAKAAKDATDSAISNSDLGLAGALLSLGAGIAADTAVELSEIADLRTSRYFPGTAWVGDFKMPAGEHAIKLRYLDGGGKALFPDEETKINVDAKRLNLVSGFNLDPLPVE